jgi:hypothetical protein
MTTEVLLVTFGAVNTPVLEIVPALADQVTPVFAVPVTLAVNRCCACDATVVLTGEIESKVPAALAETTICAVADPYSFPGRVGVLGSGIDGSEIDPFSVFGKVKT